jgi:hypothetical protein
MKFSAREMRVRFQFFAGPISRVIAGMPLSTHVVSTLPGSPGSILMTSGCASSARRWIPGRAKSAYAHRGPFDPVDRVSREQSVL